MAVWLGLAASAGALHAQSSILPPTTAPDANNSSAEAQGTSKAAQQGEIPLPNKMLGQVPFTARYAVQGEMTFILQRLAAFRSPYAGLSSLHSRNETEMTNTYTLYLGARPTPRFEVYINPELAVGNGVSNGVGLAGYSNGDLIGQPSLRPQPYFARAFVRWRIPLRRRSATQQVQAVAPAPNLIGGTLPADRLVITAGKFAVSDHFDTNSYANNPRLQFLNNALVNNLAYDKAGDTRGYDLGLMVNWITSAFALRLGTVAMPTSAGGPDLAYALPNASSEQMELEVHPHLVGGKDSQPLIVRLLAYRNTGMMGRYQNALDTRKPGTPPDISAMRRRGAAKYGFGLNMEQPLGDGGATGVFGRLGWNDGSTESFSYAEADRFVSAGGQLSGQHWHRANDILGAALAQSDLSRAHKAYLAAGGLGLSLGDGKLTYGSEQIAEVYYSYRVSPTASLSPDYQWINHPGDNRDRGPVSLLTLRMHLTF